MTNTTHDNGQEDHKINVFTNDIKPLMDQLYSVASQHDIPIVALCAYGRADLPNEPAADPSFLDYQVAYGHTFYMPDVMIAIAALLNDNLLANVGKTCLSTMKTMLERNLKGKGPQPTPDELENLRVGTSLIIFVNALIEAGIVPFKSRQHFESLLATIGLESTSPPAQPRRNPAQKPSRYAEPQEKPLDPQLAEELRNLLDRLDDISNK